MSSVNIDPVCRRRMQPHRSCRSGMLVNAQFQSDLTTSLNQVARFRRAEFFRSTGDVTGPVDSRLWRFAGHISPVANAIVARVLMAPATQTSSTSNPRIQLALYDSTGNAITSGTAHFGTSYGKTPDEVPAEWGVATIGLDVGNYRDTAFRAQLHAVDEARPISCTVYEVAAPPDTDEGYCRQQFSVGAPILDSDRSEPQDLAHALYKRGGPSLFTYSSDVDASPIETFSATYENHLAPFGGGGARLDQRFCNRKTLSTIPAKFECYAGMTGGSGNVRVVDSAGNVYATFAVSGSAAWQTALTANLPADERMYSIECKADGVNIIRVYALSAFRYQS